MVPLATSVPTPLLLLTSIGARYPARSSKATPSCCALMAYFIRCPLSSLTIGPGIGIEVSTHTTQIEPHDYVAELFMALSQVNTIMLDMARDMWGYIRSVHQKLCRGMRASGFLFGVWGWL